MPTSVASTALVGIEGVPVEVEVDVAPGIPATRIVGLPDTAVGEARERIRSAIRAAGYTWPARRITINLAPADLRKSGGSFDLAIAIGILLASGQIRHRCGGTLAAIGELALDGRVRNVPGALPLALPLLSLGHRVLLPSSVAMLLGAFGGEAIPIETLADAAAAVNSGVRGTTPAGECRGASAERHCLIRACSHSWPADCIACRPDCSMWAVSDSARRTAWCRQVDAGAGVT